MRAKNPSYTVASTVCGDGSCGGKSALYLFTRPLNLMLINSSYTSAYTVCGDGSGEKEQ